MADFLYQATLGAITVDGCDPLADYAIAQQGIGGLTVTVKAADADLNGEHGSSPGDDLAAPRGLTVPTLIFQKNDPGTAMTLWRALKAEWKPAGLSERVLAVALVGLGPADHTLRFYGRPRTTNPEDLSQVAAGRIATMLGFTAFDPVGYGPSETVDLGALGATVANAGDAETRRAVISIEGDGSVPQFINAGDQDRFVQFALPVPNGQTWELDLRRKTLLDGSGGDRHDALSPSSTWFSLQPGDNAIAVSGVTGASITYRSGWW